MHPDDIPGVREARAWEASTRAEAFLGVPRTVCGVKVLPLTLYRLAVLTAALSPFLCGGTPDPADVSIFLWVVSPQFLPCDGLARERFRRRLHAREEFLDLPGCVQQIGEFLDDQFLDAPAGRNGSNTVPITSSEAAFIELFGDAFGWTPDVTLHLPLPQLYQILRRITLRRDPKAIFVNRRSDRVRGEWLRSHRVAAEMAETSSNL